MLFRPIGKTRWPPWPLIGWDISDFSSETAERNSTKLYGKQDLKVLYQVCVFGTIGKTRWPPWPLIGWDIFDFSSETTEWNLTKLDRKQDLNVLYQVCDFWADRKKQDGRPGLWLAEAFQLLLWNRWTEFNETWQEARSQRPLPSLCFSGQWEKQDGRPGLWFLGHFRLLLCNRWTEFNETWQEARSQCPLPSLCFLGRLEKQDGRPGQSAKKVAHCTQVHDMWPFGPLVYIPYQINETVANWDQNRFDLCGELSPCITITIMNILTKWNDYESFVFIFLLRWRFLYTIFVIWINVKYFRIDLVSVLHWQ